MSNLSELRKILTALGGTPSATDTNDETLAKIYSKISANDGLGDKLPEVDAGDDGDVLTVVSGKWAKAQASGGGGVIVANENVQTGVLDKTWQELFDADYAVYQRKTEASGKKGVVTTDYKEYGFVVRVYDNSGTLTVIIAKPDISGDTLAYTLSTYVASTADDYPEYYQEQEQQA